MNYLIFLATVLVGTNVDIFLARQGVPGAGVHIGVGIALAVAFFVATAMRVSLNLERFRGFMVLFLLLLVWSLISGFFSLDVELSLVTLARYIVLCVGMLLLASLVDVRADFTKAVAGGLLASLVIVTATIFIDAIRPGTFSQQLTRAAGLYINPNNGAQALILNLVGLVAVWRKPVIDRALVFAYVLVMAGVFLTLSRSGVVLFVITSAFLAYIYFSRRMAMYAGLLSVALVAVIIMYMDPTNLTQFQNVTTMNRLDKLFTLDAYLDGDDERVQLLRAYLGDQVGVFGWGPGASALQDDFGGATHNTFVKLYWESGLVATFLYSCILLYVAFANRTRFGMMSVGVLFPLSVFTNYNLDNRMFYFVLLISLATQKARVTHTKALPRIRWRYG
jgi:hypothetical protein